MAVFSLVFGPWGYLLFKLMIRPLLLLFLLNVITLSAQVVTWGDGNYGGDSSGVASELSSDVSSIYSTSRAFAAVKYDGSVVTWEIAIMEATQAA